MRRLVATVALVLAAAMPRLASADDGERFIGYGGFGSGFGGMYGPLGKEFDADVVRSTLHGGLRMGEIAASLNLTFGFFGSHEPTLHSDSLVSFELGPNVRYTFDWPSRVAQAYVRGGVHRLWWQGDRKVRRTCEQTGACTAGFYQETPSYAGWSGRVGVGIQITPPMRRRRSPYMHIAFDIGYDLAYLKLIDDYGRGHLITASVQLAYGGGRKGRQR